jgi:hypothetical protein
MGLQQALEKEVERARFDERPVSLLLIDIARFKSLNERLSISGADKILKELAVMLKDSTRLIDTVRARRSGVCAVATDRWQRRVPAGGEDPLRMRGSMLGSPRASRHPQGWRNFPVMRRLGRARRGHRQPRQRHSVGTERSSGPR